MKTQTSIQAILKVALLFGSSTIVACGDPDEDDTGDSSSADSSTSASTTAPTTSATTTTATTTTATTTTATTTTETSESSGVDSSGSDTTETAEDPFEFADDPYGAYTQIDRHGAVEAGTAGILASQGLGLSPGSNIDLRDDYNASNPAEDSAGMWLSEIANSVVFFHNSFDDDIDDLGLIPASVDETVAQAGPVILPDTIKYDPSMATAYPNGRNLEDRVVDITLAAVLLQLGPGQPLDTFSSIPLNPGANDVPFEADFPYLAPPH